MSGVSIARLWPVSASLVDEAQEIGAVPVRSSVTAMRVGQDNGQFVYLGEIPVYVATAWRIVDAEDKRRHRWWRLEIKIDVRNGAIQRGDELVVAEHPYANGWLQHAAFKPGSKKGALERPELSETSFGSSEAFLRWIENLNYDFWEKGNYLTAGICEPDLPFSPSQKVRNVQRQALYVFGSCENFSACEQAMYRSEVVQWLLKDTEHGTIRFWPPKAKIKEQPRLHEEVKAEASSLMLLSIRQALAGPHKKSDEWMERAVVDKVDQIYRQHLNNRNRVIARRSQPQQVYREDQRYQDYLDETDDFDPEN